MLGIGLGIYATPSTDTAVDNVPDAKAGEAAGIYKMSSTLGGSFGLAISVAIYSAVEGTGNIATAASLGLIANVIFAGTRFILCRSFDSKTNYCKISKKREESCLKDSRIEIQNIEAMS